MDEAKLTKLCALVAHFWMGESAPFRWCPVCNFEQFGVKIMNVNGCHLAFEIRKTDDNSEWEVIFDISRRETPTVKYLLTRSLKCVERKISDFREAYVYLNDLYNLLLEHDGIPDDIDRWCANWKYNPRLMEGIDFKKN